MRVKKNIFILISLYFYSCKTTKQINYSPALEKTFYSFTTGQNSTLRDANSVAIIDGARSTVDTLNKDAFIKLVGGVVIVAADSTITAPEVNVQVWLAARENYKDSTIIKLMMPYSHQLIKHVIINNSVSTYIIDFFDTRILKRRLQDTVVSSLAIKTRTVLFTLNKPANADEIFGEAEIISEPFYAEDGMFKGGFIKKRYHLFYKFKLGPQKL